MTLPLAISALLFALHRSGVDPDDPGNTRTYGFDVPAWAVAIPMYLWLPPSLILGCILCAET